MFKAHCNKAFQWKRYVEDPSFMYVCEMYDWRHLVFRLGLSTTNCQTGSLVTRRQLILSVIRFQRSVHVIFSI